jgi:simple sugar transport system ATP-binding protein
LTPSPKGAKGAQRDSAAPPVLSLKDVAKSYGYVKAVRGVDLEMHAGRVHGLVGDNGAGKSTLLKMIAGVHTPDTGHLEIDGERVDVDSPSRARELGIETVYQDLALADERSCSANVFIGREVLRPGFLGLLGVLNRREMARRAAELFKELSIPITDVDRPVRLLSGGQRQGVAIARSAAFATKVILLDEPTAALGVRQRGAVETLVERQRDRGLATLLVSHDIPEVLRIADDITVLRQGSRVATSRCEDVDTTWVVGAMVGEEVAQ